jgi:hypothetical protein
VYALAVSDSTVYVGGAFTTIGGQTRHHIAAVDTTNGFATGWNPNADDVVYSLAASGGTVYAGGQFTNIGGKVRNYLAALDGASGAAITSWNPNASDLVDGLAVSGNTVYAGGNFRQIAGSPHSYLVGMSAYHVAGVEGLPRLRAFGRLRASPDPSRGDVTLRFDLPRTADVEIGVYDLSGRLIRHLRHGVLGAGAHQEIWDGRTDAGQNVSGGMYFVRVRAGAESWNGTVVRAR